MTRAALVAGIELAAPKIEKRQSRGAVGNLVAKIVGDAAVGVDGVEVRTQRPGQKPCCDVEVFVVRLGQPAAIGAGLVKRRRNSGMR